MHPAHTAREAFMPLLTFDLEQRQAQTIDKREAEQAWARVRTQFGFRPYGSVRLIKTDGNTKLDGEMGRSNKLIGSHTLPSGRAHGTCVNDSTCHKGCVVSWSFRATQESVQRSRQAMLELLATNPDAYATLLVRDAKALARKARRSGRDLALRMNVGSDVAWERWLPAEFWDVIGDAGHAYDYTKRIDRVGYLVPGVYRTAYSLTAATRPTAVARILGRGDTVVAVLPQPFRHDDKSVPATWHGFPMISGDATDDRFLDPAGVVVGLSAKGRLLREYRRTGTWGPLVVAAAFDLTKPAKG